jgi:hypothetical protein
MVNHTAVTSAHPNFGSTYPTVYTIDGVEGKELTLVRGVTYTFDGSMIAGSHPFYITNDANGGGAGTQYTSPASGAMVLFTPTVAMPNLLYYQCANHSNMGWKINLITPASATAFTSVTGGVYTTTVTAANGCTASTAVTVTNSPALPFAQLGTPGVICQGSPLELVTSASVTLGAATYAWTAPDGTTLAGANPTRANAQPSMSGTYTVTITDINGCSDVSSEAVIVNNSTGFIELAGIATNTLLLHRNCDNTGWTYYSDPSDHTKLLFGINWAPDGTLDAGNAYAKDHAEVKIQVRAAGQYGESQPLGLSSLGTWTMDRWWEVHIPTSYTINEPVNIQFFYSTAEKAAIEADAAAFQNANCNNAYPNPPTATKCGYEGFQWFKIDGVYSDANVGNAVTPDYIIQSTPLTNTNATTAGVLNGILYAQFNGLSTFSTGSGGVGVGPTNSPLPITLLSFSGKINGEVNDLYWTTATEANSKWHVIERSNDGFTDWAEVGRRNAAGTTTTMHNYTLTDSKPFPKSYYRLRNIDVDGTSQLSQVILLERKKGVFGFVGVYPNPTTGNVRIEYESESNKLISLSVIDELGRVLQQKQVETLRNGINDFDIDLSNYPDAVYMVTIDNGAKRNVTKVVKIQH